VVSLTLVSICTLASVVGSMMPLAARFFGVDPAVASAPFVTTIVDATGLLVYFMIAKAILNL
jgi:magnesium transporter